MINTGVHTRQDDHIHSFHSSHSSYSSRQCPKRRQRASTQKGFSIFEVIFALVLSLIGFAAVFSMQSTQMSASLTAKEMSSALNLGERVVSQLHKESYMWTQSNRPDPHLSQSLNQWHSFTPVPVDHNFQAHIDDDPQQGTRLRQQRFCVHYWFKAFNGMYEGLLNGRVRVIWPRNPLDQQKAKTICAENQIENYQDQPGEWSSITSPFVLRRHPQ
jgi:hypothetical protein